MSDTILIRCERCGNPLMELDLLLLTSMCFTELTMSPCEQCIEDAQCGVYGTDIDDET